jgi:hypothetical protein
MSKDNIKIGKHEDYASDTVDKLVKEDGLDINAAMYKKIENRIVYLLDSLKNELKAESINSLDEILNQAEPGSLMTLVDLEDVKDKIKEL